LLIKFQAGFVWALLESQFLAPIDMQRTRMPHTLTRLNKRRGLQTQIKIVMGKVPNITDWFCINNTTFQN